MILNPAIDRSLFTLLRDSQSRFATLDSYLYDEFAKLPDLG
jgi:hypothetical protein